MPLSRLIPRLVRTYPGSEARPMMKDRRLPGKPAFTALSKFTTVLTAAALALVPVAASAQESRGPRLLRDAEIEQVLRDYTRPILRAAGLEKQNIQVVIINDSTFNAFV